MKILVAVLCVMWAINAQSPNVTQLAEGNFSKFLIENPYSMVMFYANWCVHCKEFAPQFDYIGYLAKQQKLPFAFAKIEASDSAKVKAKYDIGAYPTLKIFINGTHITYKKEQTAEAIFEYCMYKYKNKVINLKTKQEVEKVKAERDLRSILISDSPEVLREYKETSLETEVQTTFYQISEALGKVTFPKIKRYPTVVLLRDFLEGDAIYHPVLGKYKFKKFLHENDIPIIARMTQDIAETFAPTQEMPKIAIILYRDDTKKDLDKEFVKLRKLIPSREYAFILSDLKTENEKNIAQLLSIQREDFPTLMIVKQEGSNLNRYIYRGQLEKNKMFTFFNDWKAGKILRTLKSDPEPEYSANQTIRNLVGKNFKREVFDNDQDVIVMFFSPTCPHCLELRPKYYNLANKYKNVKFNVFDATANEVEGINVDGYPMIMIYPSGKKDNPITKMGPNEEDIVSLLKEHCTLPLGEVVEPKKEEEKPKTEEAKQEDKPKTEEVKQEEKPKTEEVKEEEKPKVSETPKKDL